MSNISKKWLKLFSDNISDEEQLDRFLTSNTENNLQEWERKHKQYEQLGREYIAQQLSDNSWKSYETSENLKIRIHWLSLYKPLCYKYINRLSMYLNSIVSVENKEKFLIEIESMFFEMCMNISYRTVVLEINDLRRSSRLIGDDSEKRYNFFIDTLLKSRDYILEFYQKYPVLYELLDRKLLNISDYVKEIITNFEMNLSDIEKYFGFENLKLSNIKFNAGDTHSNGKSVCILELNNKRKIVYKPRNMSVDVNLDLFSKEFASQFSLPNVLFLPRTLSKSSYSFVEFVEVKECNSRHDVEMYYENIGMLLAFLHIFGAKDYHGENILSCESYPYLIDNETILHFSEKESIDSSIQRMYDVVTDSVYSVGILPMTLYSVNNDKGMEIGALNSGEKRESPYQTHQLTNIGTDEIRIEKVFKEIEDFPSTVRYMGKTVSCKEYRENVLYGFELIYRIILKNRNKVQKMIMKYFENCETRYIYRNTNIYIQFLETSHHPDLLRNKYDFEMYMLRMLEYGNVDNEFDKSMIKDEINQLRKGDVPIFYTSSSSNEIYNGLHSRIYSLEGDSIIKNISKRICSLSEENLLRQQRIINMAFMGSELFIKNKKLKGRKLLKKLSSNIIERILSAKLEFNDEISWLNMLAMNKNYEISPMDYNLYGGTSGMILGISSIQDDRLESILRGVIDYTNNYIESCQGNFPLSKLGAFTGIYGYLYVTCVLRQKGIKTVDNSEEFIYNILLSTYNDVRKFDNLDIIGGLAGILAVLVKIEEVMVHSSKVVQLAHVMSEEIVEKLIEVYKKQGYWMENDPGYAHGNYGVITQLFKYSKLCNEESIEKNNIIFCIQDYLNKERSQLKTDKIIPLRKNAKYYSWCNGIVGIVQAKHYLMVNEFPDQYLEEEVRYYVTEILNQRLNIENSICHGNVGNLTIISSIIGDNSEINKKILSESELYLLDKLTYDCDDWGILTGELGILMANYETGRAMLNNVLLLN